MTGRDGAADETSPAGATRRSLWVIGDQVFSSVTNFALSVLVARNVSAEEFGAFGVAFATYLFVLAVATGLWSAPVAVTHAGEPPATRLDQVARSAGAALVTGSCLLPPLVGVAAVVGGATGSALLPIGVLMPGLLLQNAWRHGFVTHAQPQKAFVNDVVWGILQIAAVVAVLVLVDDPTATPLVAAWALAGALAGIFASAQCGRLPRVRGVGSLWREHRRLGPNFAGEAVLVNGQAQVTLIALAAVSGVAATAGYRGAQVVFGPQRVLSNGLAMAALPETVRVRHDHVRLRRAVGALSAVNTAVVVAVGSTLLLLPDSVGEAVLGSTWSETVPVLLPMTLYGVMGTIASGPSVGLRAIGHASTCLRIQLIIGPLALAATIVGMSAGGAPGAAWGLAGAWVVSAAIWVYTWRTRYGEYRSSFSGAAGPDDHGP